MFNTGIEKEWPQHKLLGWAPGYYSCTCVRCGVKFMGDKLAHNCYPCAKVIEDSQLEIFKKDSLNDPVTIECVGEELFNYHPLARLAVECKMGRNEFIRTLLKEHSNLTNKLIDTMMKYSKPISTP